MHTYTHVHTGKHTDPHTGIQPTNTERRTVGEVGGAAGVVVECAFVANRSARQHVEADSLVPITHDKLVRLERLGGVPRHRPHLHKRTVGYAWTCLVRVGPALDTRYNGHTKQVWVEYGYTHRRPRI